MEALLAEQALPALLAVLPPTNKSESYSVTKKEKIQAVRVSQKLN